MIIFVERGGQQPISLVEQAQSSVASFQPNANFVYSLISRRLTSKSLCLGLYVALQADPMQGFVCCYILKMQTTADQIKLQTQGGLLSQCSETEPVS